MESTSKLANVDETDEAMQAIFSAVEDMTSASNSLEGARSMLEALGFGRSEQGAALLDQLSDLQSELAGMAFALGETSVDLQRRRALRRLGKQMVNE